MRVSGGCDLDRFEPEPEAEVTEVTDEEGVVLMVLLVVPLELDALVVGCQ